MRWTTLAADARPVATLVRELGLSRPLAQLLVLRGLTEPAAVEHFLRPRLKDLDDPSRLTHLNAAVERLRQALLRQEDILVFGDYDVDGITSTTLLVAVLRELGANPRFVVPRRMDEGYGLSMRAILRATDDGAHLPKLLVAVDCGTNSHDVVAFLRERGTEVIILDHHACQGGLPEGAIVVNPVVFDAPGEPWRDLCSVGLTFKVLHGLVRDLRQNGPPQTREVQLKAYLDLVAMGTIADLVPLRGENRILARHGLERLRSSHRPGLRELCRISGMRDGEDVTPFDISFRIGPRINASGRLNDAIVPIQLLLADNLKNCAELAQQLDDLNRERQDIERAVFEEAEAQLTAQGPLPAGLLVHHAGWHSGVVGIVASRLTQKYHRPAIVLGSEGDMARGSGRSVPGLNLIAALERCAPLLTHWGGHPMAVGITLEPSKVRALAAQFDAAVRDLLGHHEPAERCLDLSCWLTVDEIQPQLLDELTELHPYGQGNPEPIFGLRRATLCQPPDLFGAGHFRFRVDGGMGRRLAGVAWKQADRQPPPHTPVDMAVRLGWNCFNGRKYPQIELVAWRPAGEISEMGAA